jgi:hypothetical protein
MFEVMPIRSEKTAERVLGSATADPSPYVLDDMEDVTDWENLVRSSTHVKEGFYSGKWSDMTTKTYTRKTDILHDWTGYNRLVFWAYSESVTDTAVQLNLDSENSSSEGGDYYSVEMAIDWSKWKQVNIPFSEMATARNPKGWNSIDCISFSAVGWDHTPSPTATLYLDYFTLEYEAANVTGPRLTDQEFFGALNLSYPGFDRVRDAVQNSDYATAKTELVEYMKSRNNVRYYYDWSDYPNYDPNETGGPEGDYYSKELVIDWVGWKNLSLRFDSFDEVRKPIGWHRITKISFSAVGWGHTPNPDAVLYFDEFVLGGKTPYVLDDMEDISDWENLLEARTYVKEGNYSGLWQNMDIRGGIAKSDILHDWSGYDSLNFWVYSATNTTVKLQLNLDSEDEVWGADNIVNHIFDGYYVGSDIDWNYQPEDDIEWTWKFNTHGYWKTLGQAYWQSGNETYAQEFVAQMTAWIEDNPVPLVGCPWDSRTWRILEAGLRLFGSWIPSYYYFLGSPSFTVEAHIMMLKSMVEHARYLSAHHFSTGNWLVHECNGLAHVGVMFPEFVEAEKWREGAYGRLYNELTNQVYPDGAQYELTTGYQQVVIQNFYEPLEIAELNNVTCPSDYLHKLETLYEYDMYVVRPDGKIPQLNDADSMNILSILYQGWKLFNRSDMRFLANDFGSGGVGVPPNDTSHAFPYAGQYVMRSDWSKDALYMIFEAGPLGAGHAHDDKLSFELYAYGKPLVLDLGRYTYVNNEWNHYFVGTQGHNTLMVDSKGQTRRFNESTYLSTGPLTANWFSSSGFDFVFGNYTDGYGKWVSESLYEDVDYSISHQRYIFFAKPEYWIISDYLHGTGSHTYDSLIHLSPCQVETDPLTNAVRTLNANGTNLLIVPLNENLDLQILEGSEDPFQGWVSYDYGTKEPAPAVIYSKEGALPATFNTVYYPYPNGVHPEIQVEKLSATSGGKCLRINGTVENVSTGVTDIFMDYYLLNYQAAGTKSYGSFQFDGTTAYIRVSPQLDTVSLVNGSYLSNGSQVLFQSQRRLSTLNIQYAGRTLNLYGDSVGLNGTRVYAPRVTKILINDGLVPFARDGDYVIVCMSLQGDNILVDVNPVKTIVGQGYNVGVNVTVYDSVPVKPVNITVYANQTVIGTLQNLMPQTGNFSTFTVTGNTTGFAYGNYTLSAYVTPVSGERDMTNNNLTNGWVMVAIIGDINGDNTVNMKDISYVARRFNMDPSNPLWDYNADIDGNGIVNMKDIGIAARNFGASNP